MKNALILHGAGNNHTGNWFPWLQKELEKCGYKVWVPDLPDSDVPNKQKWLSTVFSNKDWIFNDESVIIGHSAGATLILRILEQLPKGVKINKAILVAGPINMGTKSEFFVYKKSLLEDEIKWDKIKSACKHFYFVCSDNDRYQCGQDQSEIAQEYLGGEIIFKPGEDHFNLETDQKYKEFPFILDLLAK